MVYKSRSYAAPQAKQVKNHKVVTIQLPIFNEKYVVHRLISSVCEINWPKNKLQILVLDDSTDETKELVDKNVSEQKSKGIDITVIRRVDREGYKAGALQNALQYTKGDYVSIIDADFKPAIDFLEQIVSAIESDPQLGFVQARWDHLNRGFSMYTEAFSLGLDGYNIVEQCARNAGGLMLNFTGSAGLLRTKAIRDAGGWSWETLSEDMDLSYRMQIKGWKSLYLRDLNVQAEVPATIAAFRTQQGRWACGSIQCAKKLLGSVWKSNKTLFQKAQASLHLTYYTLSLWMFLGLIVTVPLLVLNRFPYVNSPIYFILFTLCTLSSFTLYYTAIKRQGFSLRKKLPYMGLLALIGYGLSAKTSIEMLSGLLRAGGDYQRVPKFNILKRGDKLPASGYRVILRLPWLEMAMMIYTALGILFAFINESWGILLYLFVYFGGFFTISYNISKS